MVCFVKMMVGSLTLAGESAGTAANGGIGLDEAIPASETPAGRMAIPGPIVRGRIVAVGRHLEPAKTLAVATALAESGIPAFELTMNSAGAADTIATIAARFGPEVLLIGAGTVLSLDAAAAAVEAGAHFLVMPHFDPEIVAWALARRIPCVPGAMTPTESWNAWMAGATAIKVFPASVVGTAFVREMRGPLPEIPLMVTGGVSVENGPAFLAVGAVAIGVGNWLTGSGDARIVRARARALLAAIRTGTAAHSPNPGPGA